MNRALLLRIHRYVGLALAPLLLVQAATGALLLWRSDAARAIDPAAWTSRHAGATISAGDAVRRAERAVAHGRVTRLFWPADRDGTFLVQLATPDRTAYATIDPAGGAVLRRGGIAAFPVELALALHFRLATGRIGMAVVLLDALALLALAGSGIAFWWPRRAPRWRQLTVRWNVAGRLVLRQLHRTAGVLISIVIGFSALTGLLLIVPELIDGPSTPAMRASVDTAAIDCAVTAARAAIPSGALRDMRIDATRVIVNVTAPERNTRAVHRVTIDLARPDRRVVLRAADQSAWWITILPLHAGDPLGTAGRLVLMLGAAMLAALAVSGPVMWWQLAALRRRAATNRPPSLQRQQPA
ncbi:PepSY-associated TM helix domain-containing protein [Sphingomonas adhaesiva]|uniref:PepSY-associated TM helix domain-containing protein n=1 Tax=Sphingomonas adhaesiva TaxID=28212 RepID=UPI002FF8A72B